MKRSNLNSRRTALLGLFIFIAACSDELVQPSVEPAEHVRNLTAAEHPQTVHAERSETVYIVMFHGFELEDVSLTAEEMIAPYGGVVRHVYEHAIQGFSAWLSSDAAAAIGADPRVAHIVSNRRVWLGDTRTVQHDPPWGLDRVDQRDLPLNDEYGYGHTGSGVTAYVIDTGIRFSHDEFEDAGGGSRATLGVDYINDGRDGEDCHGHGTHVAGILGGKTYGVAKEVDLVSVRVGL